MLEKALYAWQAHTFLAITGIVFGFVLVSMFYKWRLASSRAKKKAAKDRVDIAAKAGSAKQKKDKQRFQTFTRWSLGIAVIVSLILAIYIYTPLFK